MPTDRQIFVEQQYPIPTNVDGVVFIPEGLDVDEEVSWEDVVDGDEYLISDESPESIEIAQTPTPLEVVEQKVIYPKGGGPVVNAVLLIEEIPYVDDYEIRVVPR